MNSLAIYAALLFGGALTRYLCRLAFFLTGGTLFAASVLIVAASVAVLGLL